MCSGAGFSVQIIQKLVGDGRTTATIPSSQPQGRVTRNRISSNGTGPKGKKVGEPDGEIIKKRRNIETNWMIELQTVFPYGCNNRCNS